jgi:hypothetical protein
MPQSITKGRGKASSVKSNTVPNKSATQAILRKQDEIIDLLKSLTAKLDADAGVTDTDYAALITAALEKVKLI